MTTGSFATDRRPRRFEDVVGQDRSVRFLSGLIRRGRVKRDILLQGTVGSGKTTLARIYANALNCDDTNPETGSPCLKCGWCAEANKREPSYLREYDVAGRGGTNNDIAEQLAHHRGTRLPDGKTKVVFFDEAHRLTGAGSDVLLKAIEDRGGDEVFIVATSQPELLQASLVSRLIPLDVYPLPFDLARNLVAEAAASKGMVIEDGALDLIAGLTVGSPRNLLNSLERFDAEERVTVADAKQVLNVEHLDILPKYLAAVAEGNFIQQQSILSEWREPPQRKVLWIRALLTSIYYNEILALTVPMHPAIDSVDEVDRGAILTGFRTRFQLSDVRALAPLFREFLQYWNDARDDVADAEFVVQCARFDLLVADQANGRDKSPQPAFPRLFRPGDGFGSRPVLSTRVRDAQKAALFVPDGHYYVSDADVRTIVNSGSFLIQEYGRMFDLSFTLETLRPGTLSPEDALSLADAVWTQFARRATPQISDHVRVCERRGDGIRLTLAACSGALSDPLFGEGIGRAAAVERLGEEWQSAFPSETRVAVRTTSASGSQSDRLRFHWDAVRHLCQGITAAFEDFDPKQGAWAPLQQLMRLSRRVAQPSQPLLVPVVARSDSLSDSAIRRASALKLDPISAFDHRVWPELYSGWELDEYRNRQTVRLRRQRNIRELQARHRDDPYGFAESMFKLESTWPDDPLARKRGRLGWWTSARWANV